MSETCGSECLDGSLCQRDAGAGRDEGTGPCWEHEDDIPRPRKLTHELQERIAHDLEDGAPAKLAAESNGISPDTYYRWIRQGEDADEGVVSDFADRVKRAEAYGKSSLLTDAIDIGRDKEDGRLLLQAFQQITDGEKAYVRSEDDGTSSLAELLSAEVDA